MDFSQFYETPEFKLAVLGIHWARGCLRDVIKDSASTTEDVSLYRGNSLEAPFVTGLNRLHTCVGESAKCLQHFIDGSRDSSDFEAVDEIEEVRDRVVKVIWAFKDLLALHPAFVRDEDAVPTMKVLKAFDKGVESVMNMIGYENDQPDFDDALLIPANPPSRRASSTFSDPPDISQISPRKDWSDGKGCIEITIGPVEEPVEPDPESIDLSQLMDTLESGKDEFAASCRAKVESFVSKQGRGALSIIEEGVRTHGAAPDSYLKVLWYFCREKPYRGHKLDSVLAKPISDIVVKEYKEFLKENESTIEREISKEMLQKVDIRPALATVLHQELIKRGIKKGHKEISKSIAEQCYATLHDTSTDTLHASMHAALGSTLATTIAHNVAVSLTHVASGTMLKFISSAAFHKILAGALAHSTGALVTALMVKMFGATALTAGGSSIFGPVAWAVGGIYVLYKLYTLPDKLGDALGEAIETQMKGKFRPWTEDALDKFVKDSFNVTDFLKTAVNAELDVWDGPELQRRLGIDTDDPDVAELAKDVHDINGKLAKGAKVVYKKRRKLFSRFW